MPRRANIRNPQPTGKRHHRSVSLERDHGASAESRPFVVTGCSNRAIRRILEGLSAPAGTRAWTLTGPFGTGKSSFGLFLSRLLGKPSITAQVAREALDKADSSLNALLLSALPRAKGLVSIVVTGAREPLADALARALVVALSSSKAQGAPRLLKEIRGASGHTRMSIDVIDRSISCLASEPSISGALIVIDELGKLLEYAAAHPAQSDVYLLQQLAEHVARSKVSTVLLGILHQDFSGYAQEMAETDRREWDKVRGRFEDIVFEQSADDMLRLIAEAMDSPQHQRPDSGRSARRSTFQALCRDASRHDLVPSGFDQAKGLSLLAKCHPLHPVTALLLGAVFKRFGQNERSAFSFITSGEPFALPDFVIRAKNGELYTIEHLYAYLVAVFGDALLSSRDGKRWSEAFNVEAQHPDLTTLELKLLRTIALLGIVGRWNGVSPTPAVLQYTMSPAISDIDFQRAMKSLQAKSAIVYRRFNDTYSLWEGSDIDVESRIADMRSQIATDASVVQLLSAHFAPRPLLARRHSYETGTLRYFDLTFSSAATVGDILAGIDAPAQGAGADGHVLVVLPDVGKVRHASPVSVSKAVADRSDVLVCMPGNASELESLARELAAVERVQAVTKELQHDATARRELSTRREEVLGRLQQTVAGMLAPQHAGKNVSRWFRNGIEQPLPTARALNELLSSVCDELFKDAPQINNEIINRRDLSSSAAAAQGNLIEKMLTNSQTEGLGIEGNPPERSVYLSVLQALGLHASHDGQWAFASDEHRVRKDARKLYAEIRAFFDEAKDVPLGLDQLFTRLRARPFGLRNGVIPIFVCAALIGNDSQVAIYEDGAFLPQVTAAVFDQIIKSPGRYKVRRWHVTGVRVAVFEQLGKMLGRDPVANQIEIKDLLDVVKPLVRFVRKLHDFTKQTKAFAPATLAVRAAISEATEPDRLLFNDLPVACGIDPFGSNKKDRRADVENFLRALQSALAELQRGYDLLLQNLRNDLSAALGIGADDRSRRKLLNSRAQSVRTVALNPEVKVFTARLIDPVAEDTIWIEQIAAFLANKHPSIWHDEDRARFTVRLAQMTDVFTALESLVHSREGTAGIDDEHESIRIAVVGNRSQQTEQVVHLNRHEATQVSELQSQIHKLFKPYSLNGNRKLAVAALARVAQSFFAAPEAQSGPSAEGSTR